MSDVLEQFIDFLDDTDASECYITGVAGTGKTTSLGELIEYCDKMDITNLTTAYTHKACNVLRSKLPKKAKVATLHSFLKKCPTINVDAKKVAHVDSNAQASMPEIVQVLFIDEFSMVGEKDFVSIAGLQFNDDGDVLMKVVYIGDPNQLPPVKDAKAVIPSGDHWIKLTTVHRQANDNPLIDTLLTLNDFINGNEPKALEEHKSFIRGIDIVEKYKSCVTDKVILAYTNEAVEKLNALAQGRIEPVIGDELFSPTTREFSTLLEINDKTDGILSINGKLLELGSKYKTLETLHEIEEVKFYTLVDENDNEYPMAAIFGHSHYLQVQKELAERAVATNNLITATHKEEAKTWAKANWQEPLAKKRSKAWGKYLAFKDNVICLDFKHAMTVHKSQGSTYTNVFLDTEDMSKCADKDYEMYLKLLYVAVSRASETVYTN